MNRIVGDIGGAEYNVQDLEEAHKRHRVVRVGAGCAGLVAFVVGVHLIVGRGALQSAAGQGQIRDAKGSAAITAAVDRCVANAALSQGETGPLGNRLFGAIVHLKRNLARQLN